MPSSWQCCRRGFDWQLGGVSRVYTEADCPSNLCINKQLCNPEVPVSRRRIRRMLRTLRCHVLLRKFPSPGSSGRRSSISAKQPCAANRSIRLRLYNVGELAWSTRSCVTNLTLSLSSRQRYLSRGVTKARTSYYSNLQTPTWKSALLPYLRRAMHTDGKGHCS